jgi:hypothetical protein
VEIEHRSACHLVRAEGKLFQVQSSDRVYQGFSVAFDASVEEVWLAFFAGATLVAGTKEMVRSGAALSRMLADAGVTVLSCVPTLLAMMDEDVPTVRLLILGGETCPPDLVKRWWRPGRRVFNTYGPTEATVIATCAECHPEEPVTIGQPVPNYLACILDEQLRPVPAGVAGELCLGGVGLARGYLGRPELTQEKFISIASDEGPAQRLYRTGDLTRWTADGSKLEFLGRIDTQVKIRGFRVELAEIESVLRECPGVQAAAVALHEDVPGVQQLVAYLVPQPATPFDENAIRATLRAKLPAYMVPALLETLPQLPMLASGKVDRKNLPAPRTRSVEERRDLVLPRTGLEMQIAAVWEKLFAPTPVSVRDDFFLDLGGHSLLAARMVSELRQSPTLRQLSMLDVYQHPTVEKLAAHFQSREGERSREPKLGTQSAKIRARWVARPPESAVLRDNPLPRTTYLSLASVALTWSKCGRSFGLGVCSLYWTTPALSITKAARAAVSPTPASIGKTTLYFLITSLFRSLASVMPIFSFCAQASCANGVSTLMPMTSALRPA